MKIVVSPAKKLNFDHHISFNTTTPSFLPKTHKLAGLMKQLSEKELEKLMKLSPKLAALNHQRFQDYSKNPKEGQPAVFAFNGDTYSGLDIQTFSKTELNHAQKILRILSGLYGMLKPLDLIQPYRLEMGTKLSFDQLNSLYQYWQDDVTEKLNSELKKNEPLINCASQEYFGVINQTKLSAPIITPVFKEKKNGALKIISFNAKRARGMFARFIIQEKIKHLDDLKEFQHDGYQYQDKLSTEQELVFTR